MAIIDGRCECAVCGERCEFNESWMDWVCEMCASGSWRMEIKRRVVEFNSVTTFEAIIETVTRRANITEQMIHEKTNRRIITEPRMVAHYLAARADLGIYSEVGKRIGNKDHGTVSHSIKTIEQLLQNDPKFKKRWEGIL